MKRQYTFKDTLHTCYFGYITQAIICNLTPLFFVVFQDNFALTLDMIGGLIFVNFITQIIVDLIAVRIVDKIGYRMSAVIAHICAASGLVLLGILPFIMPAYLGFLIAIIIYSFGGGFIEVTLSPIVDSLPSTEKSSGMALLHSFFSIGQILVVLASTLFIQFFGNGNWFILPLLWSLIPLYNLYRFTRVPLMPTLADEQRTPIRQLFQSRTFVLALVIMICAGASELAMSQWASLFAEKGLHVSKLVGDLLGPCLFAVFMTIGRLGYGFFGSKFNMRKILVGSSLLCIACYLAAALFPNPILSLFGCALCGLSVCLMWPGMFTLSSDKFPLGGAAMFGILAIFGDIGCAIGPFVSGVFSNFIQSTNLAQTLVKLTGLDLSQIGLRAGMLITVIFPIILFICLLMFQAKPKKSK